MNKVIVMGRLTRDPDVRYTQGEQSMAVARFTIAVDRKYKKEGDGQSADFLSCVTFGKIAEFIGKYCHQGTKLVVEGRIQTGSYTNRDGIKVYTTDIVVESAEFAESKAAAGQESGKTGDGQEARGNENREKNTAVDADGFMSIPDGLEDEGIQFC